MVILDLLDSALAKTVHFFAKINFLDTIELFAIHENSISIASDKNIKLYGCKLETKSNRYIQLNSLKTIGKDIKHDSYSQIYLYMVKQDDAQGIYVFSYSETAIDQVCKEFEIEKLSGEGMVKAFFKIFMIGTFRKTDDNRLAYQYDDTAEEPYYIPWLLDQASGKFTNQIKQAHTELMEKGTVYQAVSYSNRQAYTPYELFSLNWEGVIATSIDFSPIATLNKLKMYERVSKWGDRQFYNLTKNILESKEEGKQLKEDIEYDTCLVNTIMYLKDGYETTVNKIGLLMSITFAKNYLSGAKVFGKTLMNTKDADFDALLPIDNLTQFFATTHKQQVDKSMFPMWYGRDISDNFINYTTMENTSPHSMIIGKTGAGKSTQAIIGLCQILGYDIDTGKASRFYEAYVRYVDVGNTSGHLAEGLKRTYGKDVKIYPAAIKNLRFSLFDIKKEGSVVDDGELRYMVNLINFALEVQGADNNEKGVTLSGSEQSFLKKIVEELILNEKYDNIYLNEFITAGVYKELVHELMELGFNKSSKVSEFPEKYNYLKKPTLEYVINEVQTNSRMQEYSELEKEDLQSLAKKLRSMTNLTYLTFHSNMSYVTERFTYMDLDEIKDYTVDFCIIFWMKVKEWIGVMKDNAKIRHLEGLPPIPTYIYSDESHIFFTLESQALPKLFISATKELRKVGGRFIFMTQMLKDLPEEIYTQLGTKIFVLPESDKKMFKNIIEDAFGSMEVADEIVMKNIGKFMMYIMGDSGSMGMRYNFNPKHEWFYKPHTPELLEYKEVE